MLGPAAARCIKYVCRVASDRDKSLPVLAAPVRLSKYELRRQRCVACIVFVIVSDIECDIFIVNCHQEGNH